MAQEAHSPAQPAGLAAVAEVVAQHAGVAPRDRQQTGAQAEQRGLPGPVRPAEEHDLSGSDLQVDPGQCGEPAQERHRAVELDDGFHGSQGSLRTPF